MSSPNAPSEYPDNPVLCRVRRGDWVESQHRGAWVLVDTAGDVVESSGAVDEPVFARSAIKSVQALPLFETGAVERWELGPPEICLAVASHDAEAQHTERVAGLLGRLGLGHEHLQCGSQMPGNRATRDALAARGEAPTALHNNCSGKHAGFLALARHLGEDPAQYLARDGETQALVRDAVVATCDLDDDELTVAIDGCSAPTFRLPLARLATGIARVANPDGLADARRAACETIVASVRAHPELVGGSEGRLCTDLAKVTEARLFGKIGAEAVYVVGIAGADRGLAVKIDDGERRALPFVVLGLLRRLGYLSPEEFDALSRWSRAELRNWAGLRVGQLELVGA